MSTSPRQSRSVQFLLWVVILGGIGFLSGFLGPIALNPGANQGPLLGIFITGPGGVVLGLILWALTRGLRVEAVQQWRALWLFGAALAGVTLYFCMPEPVLRGYVLEGQVLECGLPAQSVDTAIDYWNKRIAAVTWVAPRAGWQNEARRQAQDAPGVILRMAVARRNRIYEGRKLWNKGMITVRGWEAVEKQNSYYAEYAGDSCSDYPVGMKSLYYTNYDLSALNVVSVDWPPSAISDFLGFQVLVTVPAGYDKLVGR